MLLYLDIYIDMRRDFRLLASIIYKIYKLFILLFSVTLHRFERVVSFQSDEIMIIKCENTRFLIYISFYGIILQLCMSIMFFYLLLK